MCIRDSDRNVCTGMDALHTRHHTVGTQVAHSRAGTRQAFDWAGQIKLAIVLSVIAALATVALADRIAEPVLIVGIIFVASVAAWARVEPVAQPVRAHVRRR